MKILKIIRDIDFGLDNPDPAVYKERKASRAVVFDKDKNIALLRVAKKGFHKLPGGGIEKGESITDAFFRELTEEIGCSVDNLAELGIIEEYRNKLQIHQTSYCFMADLVGEKGLPTFDEGEMLDGFEPVWMNLKEAIETLKREASVQDYGGKFIQLRDLTFLRTVSDLAC